MLSKNKLILSNTLMLFVRIFVITMIGLYSLRIVINGLGVEDYGLFVAINGVVLLSSCLVPVFSLSLQRFYSYYLGRKDTINLQKTYSSSINIIITFLLIILLLYVTIGRWFVFSQMSIPTDKIEITSIIFNLSIGSLFFSILQIPFTASIFANEDMGVYTLVSSIDCVLKLIVAITIGIFDINNLVYYSGGLCVVAFIVFVLYAIVAKRKYKECKYILVKDVSIYKSLLSFSVWTTISSIAGISIIQGSSILLNIFFGPLANAAFGVANNMFNAFNSLSNSIVLAFRPAMIKAYSAGNHNNAILLFNTNNKAIYYLLLLVSVPLIAEMPFILQLWLGSADALTIEYCRLFIVYTVILTLHNPITTILQASGNLKQYTIYCDIIMLLHIPIAWLFCKLGLSSLFVFVSIIIVCVMAHINRVICINKAYRLFNLSDYNCKFVMPSLFVTIVVGSIAYLLHSYIVSEVLRLILITLSSVVVTIAMVYKFGINYNEQQYINNLLRAVIHRNKEN